MHWRRKWQPTPVFLPGNPRDGGAWWAAVYGSHRVGHDCRDLVVVVVVGIEKKKSGPKIKKADAIAF